MLILNATDLDRSREYGQESIIYSLEGSSQFRIGARSGEPLALLFCTSADSPAGQDLPVGQASSLSQEARVSQETSFEHLVPSLSKMMDLPKKSQPEFIHRRMSSSGEESYRVQNGSHFT